MLSTNVAMLQVKTKIWINFHNFSIFILSKCVCLYTQRRYADCWFNTWSADSCDRYQKQIYVSSWTGIRLVHLIVIKPQLKQIPVNVIAKTSCRHYVCSSGKQIQRVNFPKQISLHHFSFHENMYLQRFPVRFGYLFTCCHFFQSSCMVKKKKKIFDSKPLRDSTVMVSTSRSCLAVWRRKMRGCLSEWKLWVNRLFAEAFRVTKRSSLLTKCLIKLNANLHHGAPED